MARTRVLAQVLLYAALGAHVAAWYGLGRREVGAVSPAGPLWFLQTGLVSAGALLMGAALLSVFVAGNAFCGWACHFGALQDFAAWLFRKLGVRPLAVDAPVRLRAVLLVKLFVVNTAATWLALGSLPRLLVRCGVPEPLFAVGTAVTVLLDVLVLAFAMTYVFGPRAFCRVLCPVILVLRLGNRAAPLRLRLRGPCNGCGTCDRVCPMRNPVSRELGGHGSVASADCVRCGRCRDACLLGSIALGVGPRPAALPVPRTRRAGTVAVAVGGLAGIALYELIARAHLSPHLPNWEFFYAALGVVLGAVFHRCFRKGAA